MIEQNAFTFSSRTGLMSAVTRPNNQRKGFAEMQSISQPQSAKMPICAKFMYQQKKNAESSDKISVFRKIFPYFEAFSGQVPTSVHMTGTHGLHTLALIINQKSA